MQVREPMGRSAVFTALRQVAAGHGLDALDEELGAVEALSRDDLAACALELERMPREDGVVRRSAIRLLDLGGKRLRPLCVALGARLGTGFSPAARHLAVAAELVHSATLLHDDVVDLGDVRRGQPTSRLVYGNAASVFAGDWLLVEALRRVQAAGIPGLLESLLATIDEMIGAESLQLERRGRIVADRDSYFAVVRGKTAALFRWACHAGAKAGGLDDDRAEALARYGEQLGVAFQLVDDALDLVGTEDTGKALFTDLREGKMTFPLVVAVERDPTMQDALRAFLTGEVDADVVIARARASGALDATRAQAEDASTQAIEALEFFEPGPVRTALVAMAMAVVHRDR